MIGWRLDMINQHFLDVFNSNIKRLRQIVPVVARVHGEHHPEFYIVKSLFDELDHHYSLNKEVNLIDIFTSLKRVSNNYQVPSDVCETYEAVYVMLSQLDEAYGSHSE
jgi:iron-sulfur cluster repair protein YtfE (RIC family)